MSAAPILSSEEPEDDLESRKWRWTRDKYYLAADVGIFAPDDKLELLDGEVFYKVSPQNTPHAVAILLGQSALENAFGSEFSVRPQLPFRLEDNSEPEPDLLVVRGTIRDYTQRHPAPQDVALLIEVSDRSVGIDRKRKLELYAQARIPEYWIVNLVSRRLEVYRSPQGREYSLVQILQSGEEVQPLSSTKPVQVADLLP